jgi:hypothetical protein
MQGSAAQSSSKQLKAKRPGLHGVQGGGLFHQEQRIAAHRKALQRIAMQRREKQGIAAHLKAKRHSSYGANGGGLSTRSKAVQGIARHGKANHRVAPRCMAQQRTARHDT